MGRGLSPDFLFLFFEYLTGGICREWMWWRYWRKEKVSAEKTVDWEDRLNDKVLRRLKIRIPDLTLFPLTLSVGGRIDRGARYLWETRNQRKRFCLLRERKQKVIKQLWESVMQCRNYGRRRRIIMDVGRLPIVLYALQLLGGL